MWLGTAHRTVTASGKPVHTRENEMHVWHFLAAAAVTVGSISPGGAAEAAPTPSVHGSGMVTLPAPIFDDDVAGDPVRFQLQAQGAGPATRGTFNVVHLDDAGGLYAHVMGDVTCLSVVDGVAYTTGIIRKAWLRDYPDLDLEGTAAAITVADRGTATDVIGFNFEFFGSTIQPCQNHDVDPFLPIETGNFTVR